MRLVKSPIEKVIHAALGEPMVDKEADIVRGSRPRAGAIDDTVAVDVAVAKPMFGRAKAM